MYSLSDPLVVDILHDIGALKNERVMFQKEDGTWAHRPNQAVKRDMLKIGRAIEQALPPDLPRPLWNKPSQIGYFLVAGVYGTSYDVISNKDVDNMEATVQEAFQGVLVPPAKNKGDRLVQASHGYRRVIVMREAVMSRVYVYEMPEDFKTYLDHYSMLLNRIRQDFFYGQ